MTTFLAIAEFSRLKVNSFHVKAKGKLEKNPCEGYRSTTIQFAPEIGLFPDEEDKARRTLAKAEKIWFINKTARAAVQVEPIFVKVTAAIGHH